MGFITGQIGKIPGIGVPACLHLLVSILMSSIWNKIGNAKILPFFFYSADFSTERAMSLWLIDEYEKRVLRNPHFQIPETIDQL